MAKRKTMKPVKILLVEDDQLDVLDIKRSFDKLGIIYTLENAKNGEEAIEILKDSGKFGLKELPDIVLIDINMPKMNGFELLQIIRNTDQWENLRCFIITTSNESVDRKMAESFKLSGYIVKPLKLNSPANMDTFNLMIDLMNLKSLEKD
jgi:CheY-like chemotaxis protein